MSSTPSAVLASLITLKVLPFTVTDAPATAKSAVSFLALSQLAFVSVLKSVPDAYQPAATFVPAESTELPSSYVYSALPTLTVSPF